MKYNLELTHIVNFTSAFAGLLPETCALLSASNLVVHPAVSRVVLHGSRGLAGGSRSDSDIDLSLIVNSSNDHIIEREFQDVVETTLEHWLAPIELDLAVIFDSNKCGLKCFEQTTWREGICQGGGVDCFGLYKTQKGFKGLVTNAGIQVRLMYPCLKIWQREEHQ